MKQAARWRHFENSPLIVIKKGKSASGFFFVGSKTTADVFVVESLKRSTKLGSHELYCKEIDGASMNNFP